MDFYKFINSNDIREYLIKEKYEFSSLEKAFVVYQSENTTFKEKFEAFHYIIDNCDDCPVEKRNWVDYHPSLKELLKTYISIQEKLIEKFNSNIGEYVYTGQFCCYTDQDWSECEFETRNFDALKNFIKEETLDIDLKSYRIRKVFLDKPSSYIEIFFNNKDEIVDMYTRGVIREDENNILDIFEGMWFDIPTPFKKGDLLVFKRKPYWPDRDELPLVLKYITTWTYEKYKKDGYREYWSNNKKDFEQLRARLKEQGDITDMCVVAYFMSEDGTFFHEVEPGCLNLEYFKGNIKNGLRAANVLSLYMKNELDLEGLQKSLSIIKQEERVREEKATFNYTEAFLKKIKIF